MASAEELTKRIARCIGIWETNRGGDDPAPKESALNTACGLAASMATIEQATMPYAVDAISRFKALRDAAAPALTPDELRGAGDRCKAVEALLKAVASAAAAGQASAAFVASNGAAIAAAGLSADDVGTMFKAAALKRRIDALSAEVKAGHITLDAAVAAIPASENLGIGAGSLKSYIRKPVNWGENRAAWQRKAVRGMSGGVGARIEAVAVSAGGTALAAPIIRSRVDAELKRTPVPGTEDIIRRVAEANNPNEDNYGEHVLETYRRLYP